MTQYDSKNWFFCQKNTFQRIEPLKKKLKELSPFFQYDSETWTFFLKMWLEELNFLKYDWTNTTQRTEFFFFQKITQRMELFFFQKITQRIELFWNDS